MNRLQVEKDRLDEDIDVVDKKYATSSKYRDSLDKPSSSVSALKDNLNDMKNEMKLME